MHSARRRNKLLLLISRQLRPILKNASQGPRRRGAAGVGRATPLLWLLPAPKAAAAAAAATAAGGRDSGTAATTTSSATSMAAAAAKAAWSGLNALPIAGPMMYLCDSNNVRQQQLQAGMSEQQQKQLA